MVRRLVLTLLAGAVTLGPPARAAETQPAPDPAARRAEQLLAEFLHAERFPIPANMSGGWRSRPLVDSPQTVSSEYLLYMLQSWEKRLAESADKRSEVRALLKLGPAAAAAGNRAVAKIEPGPDAVRLAYLLGRVGGRRSVPLLIDLLARSGAPGDNPQASFRRTPTYAATTWALWQVSGRRFQKTSADWKKWWEAVEGSFLPARDRDKARVSGDQVAPLLKALAAGDDELIRERLIVLGPNAVPHLLKALPGASGDLRYRLCWVIDEIGSAGKLPAEPRRDYFLRRLVSEDVKTAIGSAARERALTQQTLADFCRTAIEADRRLAADGKAPHMRGWITLGSGLFKQVLNDPKADIPAAAVVLVKGLKDTDKAARRAAVRLAGMIGFVTKARPKTLVEALEKAWLADPDDWLRYETAVAFGRYDTAALRAAIRKGLWSDREEIVGDSAALAGNGRRMNAAERDQIGVRLADLTFHANDRVRQLSVRSLRSRAPDLLGPHLDRLCADPMSEIRSVCAAVMGRLKDPAHTDLLVRLLADKEARVRGSALQALGNPAFREAVPHLAPLLRDPQDMYRARIAIERIGGPEAAIVLIREFRAGNDVRGTLLAAVKQVTGKELRTADEMLAWWWSFPLEEAVIRPTELDQKKLPALWNALGGEEGPEAYRATRAMAGGGERAAAFLTERVSTVSIDDKRLKALIADLDDDTYAVRAKAFEELSRIAPVARSALEEAQKPKPSAEVRASIELLLAACDCPYPATPAARRTARAIRILELIGTQQAVKALGSLAEGDANARPTQQAKAALVRLAEKKRDRGGK